MQFYSCWRSNLKQINCLYNYEKAFLNFILDIVISGNNNKKNLKQ